MKIVIFGLTLSSTWGNGHATLWRGLCRALHDRNHSIVFYEHDMPYYAGHRDLVNPPWCRLVLYPEWTDIAARAGRDLADADVAIVTSYCPDSQAASDAVLASRVSRKVFYDLDSPVTLEQLGRGHDVPYVPAQGLGGFDLVLSYAGGAALDGLKTRLQARAVAPLYGSVDPAVHHPVAATDAHRNDLSYLGTYAADRQELLERLFVAPAQRRPAQRFALAGSQYPANFPWADNIFYFSHVPPQDHPSLFCSSGLTLNITRAAMSNVGYCPSGRLFEAAACGAAIISDWWRGLDEFFTPGDELLIVRDTDDVLAALDLSDAERRRIGTAARERTLRCHTAAVRARELERILESDWHAQAGAA